MRIKHSISYKVVAILVPSIIVVMTILGVSLFFSQRGQEMNAVRARTHQTAERVSSALVNPLWNVNHPQIEQIILLEMATQDIQAILVYEYEELSKETKFSMGKIKNAQGETTDYFPDADTEHLMQASFLCLKREIVKIDEVNNVETLIGFVEVVATDYFVKKHLENLVITGILQIIIVSVMIILIGVFSLKYTVFNPLLVLRNAVGRFRTGDFATRIPVQSQTEIGILAGAFNTMAWQLQENFEQLEVEIANRKQAEDELRKHRDHLEELVKERTNELMTVNEQLQQAKEAADEARRAALEAKDVALEAQCVAEAANHAKSKFLAGISHELRTPLTAILGFAQIMSRSQNLPPEHQENLSAIIRNGQHLLILVNRLIEVSKDKAGHPAFNEQGFDLHRLLDKVKAFESRQADPHGTDLQPNQAEDKSDQKANQNVLTPAALAALPEELRTELQQAVEVVDLDTVLSLIVRIRQQNEPLAEVLAELAKNYRFDILQELFEKILC